MSGADKVFAVTYRIPRGPHENVHVIVNGRAVTITSRDGFRREFVLPSGARADALAWQVYGDILEVRAPFRPAGP